MSFDEEPDEDEEFWRALEMAGSARGTVELRRYDADLIYANGHVDLTPGVVGTAGGPPIGLYPNPSCGACGRLMFHVLTVDNRIREYGDGFRSLFVCETCRTAACTATGWN